VPASEEPSQLAQACEQRECGGSSNSQASGAVRGSTDSEVAVAGGSGWQARRGCWW
jgi:hypothetical protein